MRKPLSVPTATKLAHAGAAGEGERVWIFLPQPHQQRKCHRQAPLRPPAGQDCSMASTHIDGRLADGHRSRREGRRGFAQASSSLARALKSTSRREPSAQPQLARGSASVPPLLIEGHTADDLSDCCRHGRHRLRVGRQRAHSAFGRHLFGAQHRRCRKPSPAASRKVEKWPVYGARRTHARVDRGRGTNTSSRKASSAPASEKSPSGLANARGMS